MTVWCGHFSRPTPLSCRWRHCLESQTTDHRHRRISDPIFPRLRKRPRKSMSLSAPGLQPVGFAGCLSLDDAHDVALGKDVVGTLDARVDGDLRRALEGPGQVERHVRLAVEGNPL